MLTICAELSKFGPRVASKFAIMFRLAAYYPRPADSYSAGCGCKSYAGDQKIKAPGLAYVQLEPTEIAAVALVVGPQNLGS